MASNSKLETVWIQKSKFVIYMLQSDHYSIIISQIFYCIFWINKALNLHIIVYILFLNTIYAIAYYYISLFQQYIKKSII